MNHSQTRFIRASTGSKVQFTRSIDAAIGIEPEAAWPVIAQLYDKHGLSAWYDLGVVCVVMVGVGTMYLSGIQG